MTNPPKNDTPDKALVERALEIFNGGLVKEPDAKNPRGFTMMYEPAKAMSAVIAALSQPQHGGLVEAARVVDAVVGSNADGCVSASAAYQKCCQAARAALASNSPVEGETHAAFARRVVTENMVANAALLPTTTDTAELR